MDRIGPETTPPTLPVGVPGELPTPWREAHAERQERRRQHFFVLLATFTGGLVGFPLLAVVANLIGWAPRDIPPIAGATAWVLGSAGVYGLLRYGGRGDEDG